MGLFAPWFLAALAGVALPLYLHLLKKHNRPPKPVPSLMLYESRVVSSTKHRRLDHILLLALRLLLLTLLILAFANPFINRDAAALASNRLVLLVIDNSFSMRAGTRLADAKDAAMSVLAGKGAARAQVATFGSQLRLMTQPIEDQSALRAAVQSIQPGDGHGTFGELARAVRATAEAVHTPIELHVFSDMQRGDLAATFSDMALPGNVKVVTHAVVSKAATQLDRRIGGRSRTGLGQGRQAGSRASRDRRLRHCRRAAQCVAGRERQDHRDQDSRGPRQRTRHRRLPRPRSALRLQPLRSQDRLRRWLRSRRPAPLRRRTFRPAKSFADPQLTATTVRRSTSAPRSRQPRNRLSSSNRSTSTKQPTVSRPTTPSSFSPISIPCLRCWKIRSPNTCAPEAVCSSRRAPRLAPARRFRFSARTSSQTRDYSRVPDRYMAVGSSDSSYPAVAKANGWPGVKFFYALDVEPGRCRA